MEGKIKKLLDAVGDATFPVTVADAIYIDETTTLADKLYAERMSPTTLIIDLERWNIIQGLPSKPYTEANYINANNNILGINRAIKFAYDNGYNEVILPRGKYSICYPTTIKMKSYLTLNLNGSTIKVMYDSDNKSPFDTRETNDYYNFGGDSFSFLDCHFAHIRNGIIVGDKYDRSFTSANEVAMEGTYGIKFNKSTSYCTVKHCEVSAYMGDPISFDTAGVIQGSLGLNAEGSVLLGDIDNSGAIVASSNSVVSKLISIPTGIRMFSTSGEGYYRQMNLNVKHFDVAYYRSDNTFIGKLLRQKIHTNITIPPNAAKLRLKYYEETDPAKDFYIFMQWGGLSHHNLIENCEIYDGHRGGISLGGSYNVIQNCVIRDNGKYNTAFLDGQPSFNDPTRYAINQEDSYGDNCVIRNNLIYGGFHGLLIGSHSTFIEGNHIYNMDSIGINIYGMSFAKITGNYISSRGRAIGLSGTNYKPAQVHISDNFIVGSLNLTHAGYDVTVHNNSIVAIGDLSIGDADFQNNHIILNNDTDYREIKLGYPKNCRFRAMATTATKPEIYMTSTKLDGCTFDGIHVRYTAPDADIINCEFKDAYFRIVGKQNVRLTGCKFVNTQLAISATSVGQSNYSSLTIKDSIFQSTSLASFLIAISNVENCIKFEVDNCKFYISNNDFVSLMSFTQSTLNTTNAKIINSLIQYSGEFLISKYFEADSKIYSGVVANIDLVNIHMQPLTDSRFTLYDVKEENITEPSFGRFKKRDIIFNASPTAGGFLGWICISDGVANNSVWTTSTSYTIGKQVHENGQVYEVISAGISGISTPTWTTSVGSTFVDGEVTWRHIGSKALFKTYGNISN